MIRAIRVFFKIVLALFMAPVILLAWFMICTGERKGLRETDNTRIREPKFYVYPDLEILEVEETGN